MARSGFVTIRFTSRWPYNPISLGIAIVSQSRELFSHVFAIVDDIAYEASMLHGCRVVPVSVAMSGVKRYQDMRVYVPDIDAAIAFGKRQDGHKYDWAGAFGIPFLMSEDWHNEDSWWCSELVFAMLMAGGAFLLDPAEKFRVTPNDLRQCFYPKSAIVNAQ